MIYSTYWIEHVQALVWPGCFLFVWLVGWLVGLKLVHNPSTKKGNIQVLTTCYHAEISWDV